MKDLKLIALGEKMLSELFNFKSFTDYLCVPGLETVSKSKEVFYICFMSALCRGIIMIYYNFEIRKKHKPQNPLFYLN